MTLTISQTPASTNLYLYPNGDDSVEMDRNTGSTNYGCVDEAWNSPNDDTDYVYCNNTSVETDVYTVENHTTETGTINYVRVIARARSCPIAQDNSGTFQIYIHDGTSSDTGSNEAPLSNSYMKYYETWTTKPSGGSWSWSAVDAMKIGVKASSPSATTDSDNYIPDGAGDNTEIANIHGETNHWEAVDDPVGSPDDTATYVYTSSSSYQLDLYTIPNSTTKGQILKVTIYMRCECGQAGFGFAKIACKTHSIVYYGNEESLTTNYANYSKEWTTNPNTGSDWTWDEIDALQIGIALKATNLSAYCTQVYMTVEYVPDIRTTQCYALVNYVPTATSVDLTDPKTVELSHSREIKRHNFPSGNYKVYDFGRASKILTLTGTQVTDAASKMDDLKTMTHYGAAITLSGLDDTNLNTDYMIQDFNYSEGEGGVERMYDWRLVLEEV